MSKEIIYSFREYQEKYTLTLGDFCKNTEFDEIDFITTEIDCYNVCLTSLSVYKRIRHRSPGDPFLDEDTIFLNTNCASYDFIVEAIKNKALSEGLNRTDGIISNYKIYFNKIISFLEAKKLEIEKESGAFSEIVNTFEIDLSDSKAVEKIIYLNELGIIDFLRTKTQAGISNGGLASVLSGITGIKVETIKPSLNRLSINDILDNKHPYYTQKTVEKVKTSLIKLGFKN